MTKVIHCQCGETVRGTNDDELVANAQAHIEQAHKGMQATRDQILAMAQPE
jgi:predicted small metal-binding protein